MKLKGKFSILASLIICLSCMLTDKADGTSFSDSYGHNSEIFSDSDPVHHIQEDEFSFSTPETQCRVPRQTNVVNTTRTASQAKRTGSTTFVGHGFTLSKSGKSMNPYTTSLFFASIIKFPSGLAESSHHLINLGKLII